MTPLPDNVQLAYKGRVLPPPIRYEAVEKPNPQSSMLLLCLRFGLVDVCMLPAHACNVLTCFDALFAFCSSRSLHVSMRMPASFCSACVLASVNVCMFCVRMPVICVRHAGHACTTCRPSDAWARVSIGMHAIWQAHHCQQKVATQRGRQSRR